MSSIIDGDVDTLGSLYLLVTLFIVIIVLIMCTVGAVAATKMFYATVPGKTILPDFTNQHCPTVPPPNIEIVVEGNRHPSVTVCPHKSVDFLPQRKSSGVTAIDVEVDSNLKSQSPQLAATNFKERVRTKAGKAIRSAAAVVPDKFMPISIRKALGRGEPETTQEQFPIYVTAEDALMIILSLVSNDTTERLSQLPDANKFVLALKETWPSFVAISRPRPSASLERSSPTPPPLEQLNENVTAPARRFATMADLERPTAATTARRKRSILRVGKTTPVESSAVETMSSVESWATDYSSLASKRTTSNETRTYNSFYSGNSGTNKRVVDVNSSSVSFIPLKKEPVASLSTISIAVDVRKSRGGGRLLSACGCADCISGGVVPQLPPSYSTSSVTYSGTISTSCCCADCTRPPPISLSQCDCKCSVTGSNSTSFVSANSM